jgi:hypothetical protein
MSKSPFRVAVLISAIEQFHGYIEGETLAGEMKFAAMPNIQATEAKIGDDS